MKNELLKQKALDYRRIEQAIGFIENNFKEQPSLDEISRSVNLSKFHFERLFKKWAGVSPKQFMQFLTLEYAREKLRQSESVLDVTYDSGLSGPGRLHDLFVTFDAVTPGEFKTAGADLIINYGFHPTPFGLSLIAVTKRGICFLGFPEKELAEVSLNSLRQDWPEAKFVRNETVTRPVIESIFLSDKNRSGKPFNLLIKGTNFQINVWRALLSIPSGSMVCYQSLAAYIGQPNSCRAVAKAIAVNPIAYLIPCHRVISKTGKFHKYRWGGLRKRALLGQEAAASFSVDCMSR